MHCWRIIPDCRCMSFGRIFGEIKYCSGMTYYHLDNIDVLDAIPTDPELNMLEKFLDKRFKRIRKYVARKREKIFSQF